MKPVYRPKQPDSTVRGEGFARALIWIEALIVLSMLLGVGIATIWPA